jgi:hypothetical protein
MSYTVYQADLKKDKNVILKFCAENRKKPLEEKFKWMYEGNPDGKAMVWLIKHDESGEYAGMTSLFPRKFFINNKCVDGGIAGDFLVNAKHRTLGPAIMLQKGVLSAANSSVDFIYGFPNMHSEPVFKRVGYKCLGPITRLVKVLKTEPQLRKFGLSEWFIALVSPVIDLVLSLFSFETWHCANHDYLCEEVDKIDERFDRLWEERKNKFSVIGEKNSDFLRWKYIDDPDDHNRVFAVFDLEKSCLKGFIIYFQDANSVEILDFLFSDDKNARTELMASFLRHIRQFKAESLVINSFENNDISKIMKKFGFLKGKCGRNVYMYCSDKLTKEMNLLKSSGNWMLMNSDQDT